MYTGIVLFRYDNVVFDDRERVHADRLQGTDEIQEKKKISWEKQTQVMTKLRTLTVKTSCFSQQTGWKLRIQSKKVSVIHFSEGVKYYMERLRVLANSEMVETSDKMSKG